MDEAEKIRELATSVRQIFMAILEDCKEGSSTKGSCAYATFLTWQFFKKFTSYQCILRGGDGAEDGGYIDTLGNRHGHYWLQVEADTGAFIVDITADQFDGPPVSVLPLHNNEQYMPGDQELIDEHFNQLSVAIALS
ncbi:TPA: hypothetical protein ACQZK0_004885 [Enterobacter mori]